MHDQVCFAAGMSGCLSKPPAIGQLLRTWRDALQAGACAATAA